MARPSPSPEAERRYREALARHGLKDVQPLYRRLLARLRTAEPDAYREAVARYSERLLPRLEEPDDEPLAAWIEYGAWLARRIEPGRTVAVDETGRAWPLSEAALPGGLLLHLPEGTAPAVPLALPENPSPAQAATLELLCGSAGA